MQAAEKSVAFLKSSPDVTTNLASSMFCSFLGWGMARGTTNDTELSVGWLPFVFFSHIFS